jgi:hypothetical protein|tara:strand:- start:691 stop:888 length:198 start_codon:yes stop_codon:yes gene_type:complete
MRQSEVDWLDYHKFASMGQALRQIMNFVEFGEDNDAQVVIYTNLTFVGPGRDEWNVFDMDTGVKV